MSIIDPVATNNATNKGLTMSPMLKKINHIAAMRTDDTILCLACGVVFAALTISFLI